MSDGAPPLFACVSLTIAGKLPGSERAAAASSAREVEHLERVIGQALTNEGGWISDWSPVLLQRIC